MAWGAAGGAAGGFLTVEFWIPIMLLCWFCCWSEDDADCNQSEGDSEGHPLHMARIIGRASTCSRDSPRRFHPTDIIRGRVGSGVESLNLPSTSGMASTAASVPWNHRSHEELRGNNSPSSARYHSAPSIIREVLHRRDWDSAIPHYHTDDITIIPLTDTPRSTIDIRDIRTCKKHHTNYKSSKKTAKEDSRDQDPKDLEEPPRFIDDKTENNSPNEPNYNLGDSRTFHLDTDVIEDVIDEAEINNDIIVPRDKTKALFKAKEVKQTYNESVKTRNSLKLKRISGVSESGDSKNTPAHDESISKDDRVSGIDGRELSADPSIESGLARSGAMHHGSKDSLVTCHSRMANSRVSVDAVSYSVAACYLQDPPSALIGASEGEAPTAGCGRGRLASDGDILETSHRPHSTAFSESDLELELEISAGTERPPPYNLVKDKDSTTPVLPTHKTRRKETAI